MAEEQGVLDDVVFIIGTFSKRVGTVGGFCVSKRTRPSSAAFRRPESGTVPSAELGGVPVIVILACGPSESGRTGCDSDKCDTAVAAGPSLADRLDWGRRTGQGTKCGGDDAAAWPTADGRDAVLETGSGRKQA